jgi:hypothetical protein
MRAVGMDSTLPTHSAMHELPARTRSQLCIQPRNKSSSALFASIGASILPLSCHACHASHHLVLRPAEPPRALCMRSVHVASQSHWRLGPPGRLCLPSLCEECRECTDVCMVCGRNLALGSAIVCYSVASALGCFGRCSYRPTLPPTHSTHLTQTIRTTCTSTPLAPYAPCTSHTLHSPHTYHTCITPPTPHTLHTHLIHTTPHLLTTHNHPHHSHHHRLVLAHASQRWHTVFTVPCGCTQCLIKSTQFIQSCNIRPELN